jgi:hypothetical protein
MTETRFTKVVCDFRKQFRLLFMISLLSIIVLVVSLAYIEAGTATYVVTVIQLVTFAAIGLLSGGLMIICARRDP